MHSNATSPQDLGFNGPADVGHPCDDGEPIYFPPVITRKHCVTDAQYTLVRRLAHGNPLGPPSLFVAFFLYVFAWMKASVQAILTRRMPSLPYFSRPMPVLATISGGGDYTLAASLRGRVRGGPQVFGGPRHARARCISGASYLPETVVVVTPGYAEVTSRSGATHLAGDGGWIARRREGMQRRASLTFGRPRTRGTSKA